MENQHRKIAGCRELSQEEIDLMNRIKAKGAELLALHEEVIGSLNRQSSALRNSAHTITDVEALERFNAFHVAEPNRWAAIAKTDIQTGLMALIRSVAQPTV